MAIYKSSFNKKPEKEEKPKKEKKIKPASSKQFKFNFKLFSLILCVLLFVACVLPNNFIKSFLLGVVGLSIYPITLISILFLGLLLAKKKYKAQKKYVAYLISALVLIWFIFHLILTSKLSTASYGVYLKETYLAKTTAGGLLFSLVSYFAVKYLTVVGAYIFSAIGLAIFVGLIIDYVVVERNIIKAEKTTNFDFSNFEDYSIDEKPIETITEEEHIKKIARRKLGLEKGESTVISSSMPTYDVNLQQEKPLSKREYILTPLTPIIPPEESKKVFAETNELNKDIKSKRVKITNFDEDIKQEEPIIPPIKELEDEELEDYSEDTLAEAVGENAAEIDDIIVDEEDLSDYETAFETEITEEDLDEAIDSEEDEEHEEAEELEDLNEEIKPVNVEEIKINDVTINIEEGDYSDEYADNKDQEDLGSTVETDVVRPSVDISKFNLPKVKKNVNEQVVMSEEEIKPKMEIPPYVAPPVELLNFLENPVRISDEQLQDNIERLEQVLEDFKVPAKVNNVQVGPAVTRYELTMPRGISVNKIAQMSDDIAMTLASNGAIRVEAPIPGKNSVGIEVPNDQVSGVSLREVIDRDF